MIAHEILSPVGTQLLRDIENADGYRQEYKRINVVQINNFADHDKLLALGEMLYRELSPYYKPTSNRHKIVKGAKYLTSGGCFGRIDPGFPLLAEPDRAALAEKFCEIGLTRLGDDLGETLQPLVQHIAGESFSYQRTYCFMYYEGDYISPHTDLQTGNRVNVQFPIPLFAASAFRVLEDGLMKLYYDSVGCLRVLGPEVWHDVVPVLRLTSEKTPCRVLLSLRYT